MKVDLHTHSYVSDGKLSPQAVVLEARSRGIDMLSITDHDTVDAYHQLQDQHQQSIVLVKGIEFSTGWQGVGVHILGLNVDTHCPALKEGIDRQGDARTERARRIAEKLEKLGVHDAWRGVQEIAGKSIIGRPHFARLLVQGGKVKNENEAFKRYLGSGKSGDIKCLWMSLEETVRCILDSGGIAVLAHPSSYRLTNAKLRRLLDDFICAGGQAMEVISGFQTRDETEKLARLCQRLDLYASSGSDFHQPGRAWSELGGQAPLPSACKPVWELWQ